MCHFLFFYWVIGSDSSRAAAQDASSTQKLVQMNTKLKRALQTIKEKIQQVAVERPEWFSDASEDTLERLNHLLTAVDQQASQLAQLQSQCNDAQEQIDQLQLTVVRKDDERALLREHLNDVELQLREALDQQTSNTAEFEAFKKEKDSLVSQYQSELKQR